uniref:NACHT domain-containing protein n=1 Tax=Moniliophthora roreri TaxID=221103 RepID=A0A0W0F6X3_MONRR
MGRTVKATVRGDPTILSHSTIESAFEELIQRPAVTAPRVLRAILPRLIIIDGLDECIDIASQKRLLSLLWTAGISHPSFPFDILIFSQPEPHITDFFNRISLMSSAILRMGIGDTFQADRDIGALFRTQFREILARHRHTMQDVPESWPGPAIILQLVQRACGQFVYATTVTKYIDSHDVLPTKRLEEVLNSKPAKLSPHAELDLLYHQVIRSCRDFATVRQILQLILDSGSDTASRSNQPWLITQVLDLDPAIMLASLVSLHPVLHVPQSDTSEPIKALHPSFSEFLRDAERSQEFYVPPLTEDTRLKAHLASAIADACQKHCLLKHCTCTILN